MFKFALNINTEKEELSPENGLESSSLGVLINHLDKAINPKGGAKSVLYKVENHGYTPNFITGSQVLYDNFINVHKNLQEKKIRELNKEEATYATTLKRILSKDKYVEPLDNDAQPILRLTGKQISKGAETYNVITNQTGVISEIGSPNLEDAIHIYLHNIDYKIFINAQQEEILKQQYRNGEVTLKLLQRRSIKTDRIVSAQLINLQIKEIKTLAESLSSLSDEELSSLGNFKSADDILTLLHS